MQSDTFWCTYKAWLQCPECAQAVMIGGPRRSTTCQHCKSVLPLPRGFWEGLMEEGVEAKGTKLEHGGYISGAAGGVWVSRAWGRKRPTCPDCDGDLGAEHIPVGHDGPWQCPHCGKSTSSHPAPAWLRAIFPQAWQLCCTEPEEGDSESVVALPADARPVLFNCPGCGAGLTISSETPRITACQYCRADLYLPDALWLSMHPVRKRASWYVLYAPAR